jgi:hypothetical protein
VHQAVQEEDWETADLKATLQPWAEKSWTTLLTALT